MGNVCCADEIDAGILIALNGGRPSRSTMSCRVGMPLESAMAHLFESLPLRGIVLKNRIGVPPMCQYSARDGIAGDWHFVHYGSRAVGGAALIITEATAVAAEGRITLGDLGIWDERQVEPLARIASFAQAQGCVVAVQLAHAGRKAGGVAGWLPQRSLGVDEGGWIGVAPSALAFTEGHALPHELTTSEIHQVVEQFASGAQRAREAGFQAVEVHAAHGFLLHQFLSPLSNRRGDAYGGSFSARTRLLREVVAAVREQWPERLPLLVRLSATDWVDGGWDLESTIELSRGLGALGVDLVDVSSGGLVPTPAIEDGPGFQTAFASRVRCEAGIATAAVGFVTAAEQADHVLRSGQADLVLVGREILRQPYWPLAAARALGQSVDWPNQYLRAAPAGAVGR
jgi:2,4-dienoyl-CoA reductase-like NADH-dependent reductase (Old Yellow Enzyme family)